MFYYPHTIRNITTALLKYFDNIQCDRYDKSGNITKEIIVPIMFAPISKIQQQRTESYSVEPEDSAHKRFYISIPRIALNLVDIAYDPTRSFGVNETRYWKDNTKDVSELNSFFEDIVPTPYNLTYNLEIRSENISDLACIFEQILPFFNPKIYLAISEFSFLNIKRDLPVIISSVTNKWSEELEVNEYRKIDAAITLVVEAFLYRPITTAKVVKVIKTRFWIGNSSGTEALGHEIDLSAFPANSAGGPPSGAPTDYDISAYDTEVSAYGYMSGWDTET